MDEQSKTSIASFSFFLFQTDKGFWLLLHERPSVCGRETLIKYPAVLRVPSRGMEVIVSGALPKC